MRTLKALLTSELRCQLLRRLLLGGVEELHERELARRESLHLGSMRRELKSLLAVNLVLTIGCKGTSSVFGDAPATVRSACDHLTLFIAFCR